MSQNPLRPIYFSKPIATVDALAKCLKIDAQELRRVSEIASSQYRLAKPIVKADGSIRRPFDALQPLKRIQAKIKTEIFSKVQFPPYLTGSLKGHDYATNASLHVKRKVIICEDIQNFFPSVRERLVYDVWLRCFNFTPEVATLLTRLTVKDGALPQGAITSSYLANLILYRWEPALHGEMAAQGITYSRYVDDIAISAKRRFTPAELTTWIGRVHSMLGGANLKAKRKKHQLFTANKPMVTTKLVVNAKVSLPRKQQNNTRAAVHFAKTLAASGAPRSELMQAINTATGRVGTLGRFHKGKANPLKRVLRALRENEMNRPFITGAGANFMPDLAEASSVPW